MEILVIIGFLSLWCGTMLWLFLCNRLFKSLEKDHPEKFIAMGKPNLIRNNTISTNIKLFRFLYHREWKPLGDAHLTSLASLLQKLLFALLACFTLILTAIPFLITRYT